MRIGSGWFLARADSVIQWRTSVIHETMMALNARLPKDLEHYLVDHCRRTGETRTQVVREALAVYLVRDPKIAPPTAADLALDLIPTEGARAIQSDNVKALARAAFRAKRSA